MSGNSLIQSAKTDLAAASLMLDNPKNEGLYGVACFHCQQAVEKSLKGFIRHSGSRYPLTHNLRELLKIAVKFNNILSKYDTSYLDELSALYLTTRYDDVSFINSTKEDAEIAYKTAEDIFSCIVSFVT